MAAPEVPAGDASVGAPLRPQLLDSDGSGEGTKPVGFSNRGADPEVTRRQDVRPPQREHQEHLRGPDADTLHTGEVASSSLAGCTILV